MRTVWYKKKFVLWCIIAFILWLMLRKRQYRAKFDAIINKSKPIEIWEYVADFSNVKRLNPTILDFTIEEESGNYDHWKYTVHYTEFLSSLPFIMNYAVAHYQVRPLSEGTFIIQSTHTTCFYTSFACVKSVSTFTFEPKAESTLCTEDISYECPAIFFKFCEKEVWFQRHAIMENLQKTFSM